MNQQSYYAVIPANVRYCKDVCDGAKLLYGEITALSNQNGYCWATNKYFADLYGKSSDTISRWISELAGAGFIATLVDSAAANSRKIWLAGSPGVSAKMPIPIGKNADTLSAKMPIPIGKNAVSYKENNKKNITKEEEKENASLLPPFQKIGEIELPENGSLEAQKPEPTSPGGGAIRVSITGPEHPDITVNDIIEPKTDAPKTSRGKSKNPRSGTQDEIELATRVIEHLNQTAGRSFRVNTGENARGIIARHREGFTEAELLEVVEFKAGKWKADPEMYEYLNPVTLFRPANFERYLQAARAIAPKPQQQTTRSSIQHFGNGDYNKKQAF